MSCCPSAPPSAAVGGVFASPTGPETDYRPGETVECYMARAGNSTGQHDDATANVPDKIENAAIPVTRTATAAKFDNVQFKLVAGSTRVPTNWTWVNDGGEDLSTLGVTLSSSGMLTGNIAAAALDKIFKVRVTASDGSDIDTVGYTFSPSIGGEDTEIRLISPLPGGIVNSKFSKARLNPFSGVVKPHTGVDMKMPDRSVRDVVAAADGEVILAGGSDPVPKHGYGYQVHVKHKSSTGQPLCVTTYNHLNKVYVTVGQKVMAGQSLGLEGMTGGSTGNHLHFECRLPDGKFIDPEPLINGELLVAEKTLPNGDADPTAIVQKHSSASLSAAEVNARQQSCVPFGPSYPSADPPETSDPVPVPSSNDPFELAWYFTMTYEVGPAWSTSSPADPEVAAGLIESSAQRRKVGYVNLASDPGGETKFGVSQRANPQIVVRTADYAAAKQIGFNNYWKRGPIPCSNDLVGIMLFDMKYLHGPGGAKSIYQHAGITISGTETRDEQLALCAQLSAAQLDYIKKIPTVQFHAGWNKRANACLAYVQSLPPL